MKLGRSMLGAGAIMLIAGTATVFGGASDVAYPEGYQERFVHYSTRNRDDERKQIVKIYANDAAMASGNKGEMLTSGSVIVMEVYKAKLDDAETPVKGADGYFETGDLAFVAVMEKRDGWGADYPQEWRNGMWEYAGFKAGGEFIERDYQPCFECHQPYGGDDYMFSRGDLSAHLAQ